jgi:translation initiation factor IF-3
MEVVPIKNYNNRTKPVKDLDPVNENITSKEVLVIDDLGEKLGVMTTIKAISLASQKELDLVVVSPNGNPPVAKFMDYSKFRYEQQRKQREMKKKTQQFELKELRLSPVIDTHDLETKLNHAIKFLQKGHKVKMSMRFFGRMIAHVDIGREVMETFISKIEGHGTADGKPKMDGRYLIVMISPIEKK